MKYFIVEANQKKGPFKFDELLDQNLKEDTLIWYKGLKNWKVASEVEELNNYFNEQPPPIPKNYQKIDRNSEGKLKRPKSIKEKDKLDWDRIDNFYKNEFLNSEEPKNRTSESKNSTKIINENEEYRGSYHYKQTLKAGRWVLLFCGLLHFIFEGYVSANFIPISSTVMGFRVFINFIFAYYTLQLRVGKEKIKNILIGPILIYILIFIIRLILGVIVGFIFPGVF